MVGKQGKGCGWQVHHRCVNQDALKIAFFHQRQQALKRLHPAGGPLVLHIEDLDHYMFDAKFLQFRYLSRDIFVPGSNAVIKDTVLEASLCDVASCCQTDLLLPDVDGKGHLRHGDEEVDVSLHLLRRVGHHGDHSWNTGFLGDLLQFTDFLFGYVPVEFPFFPAL